MAKMVPNLSETTLNRLAGERATRAEIKVFRALRDALPDTCLVRYRVPWLSPTGDPVEGEADFVVFDPKRGVLTIEVKGGGVEFDPTSGDWTSTDRDGNRNHLHDPFAQASNSKHQLHRMLSSLPEWKRAVTGRITLAHATFFPDLTRAQCNSLRAPHIKPQIIGSHNDLSAIRPWVDRCFDEFARPLETPLGERGVRAAEVLLCRAIKVRPLAARAIEDEEERRITLTEQQMMVLEVLEERERVGISGGAGTGKTLLARSKAERLAAGGRSTLLVCFNKPLATHLERSVAGTANLTVCTLQKLFTGWIAEASARLGRNLIAEAEADYPGRSHFDVIIPHAFLLAVADHGAPPFDAVIVDEGQDFGDEAWCALEYMIDARSAALWIFFDPNQRIYKRARNFPIQDEGDIYPLTRNCRNTVSIHNIVYNLYRGPRVSPPGIAGIPFERETADTLAAQAKLVQATVRRYLTEEVSAADIVVLVLPTDEGRRSFFDLLGATALPSGVQWTHDVHGDTRRVLVDTVARFKGLEAAVLVLWLGLDIDAETHREFLYVGASRARSRLVLVGTTGSCAAAVAGADAALNESLKPAPGP